MGLGRLVFACQLYGMRYMLTSGPALPLYITFKGELKTDPFKVTVYPQTKLFRKFF